MLKNLPKMHGRQTRKGSMKVGPDPAQVGGSSADFDFLKAKKDWEECDRVGQRFQCKHCPRKRLY